MVQDIYEAEAEDNYIANRNHFINLGLVLGDAYRIGLPQAMIDEVTMKVSIQAKKMYDAFEALTQLRERRDNDTTIH